MKNLYWALLAFFILAATSVTAETVEQKIRAILAERLPQFPHVDAIAESPIAGLYEVTFGTKIIYVDESARYLMNGDMLDLQMGISLTKERTQGLQAAKLGSIDEKDMIIYGNKDAKHTVTIFTDVECGYCRKLHTEMDQYIEQDIRIRYLAYPRKGIDSDAAKIAESVWCSDDRNKAMDIAKQGSEVEAKTCENPVAAHYALGQQFGITGTPAMILDDGEIVLGYVPAKQLKLALVERGATK